MLGLKRGTVALFDHEKEWELNAAAAIKKLKEILGDTASDIQHVGSTSIKAIKAKPIIDIAVAVKGFEGVKDKIPELQSAGFYCRDTELMEQMLFASGSFYENTGEMQTHFVHVVKESSMDWRNYINFRDYLNAEPEVAKEYESLKLKLAAEYPLDNGREHYLNGKSDFIKYTLRKAMVWSFLGKEVTVTMDRPLGYVHKKEKYSLTYPINYGYIEGVLGGDGEELDVYVLGEKEPLKTFDGRIIGIVHRENDVEDKLVAAKDGTRYTEDEIAAAVNFQEQYYKTHIEALKVGE